MNEPCHIWKSHAAHMQMLRGVCDETEAHTYVKACMSNEWVVSHIRMSRVTHTNESCHIRKLNEICHTYIDTEWSAKRHGGLLHVCGACISHVTDMSNKWVVTHTSRELLIPHTHRRWVECATEWKLPTRMYGINTSCHSREGRVSLVTHTSNEKVMSHIRRR